MRSHQQNWAMEQRRAALSPRRKLQFSHIDSRADLSPANDGEIKFCASLSRRRFFHRRLLAFSFAKFLFLVDTEFSLLLAWLWPKTLVHQHLVLVRANAVITICKEKDFSIWTHFARQVMWCAAHSTYAVSAHSVERFEHVSITRYLGGR